MGKQSRTRRGRWLTLAVLSLIPQLTYASGPYVVDDADIVEPNTLQSETWLSHSNKGETLGVFDMIYQVAPKTELTLAETRDDIHGDIGDILSPQIKYLWRSGEENQHVMSSIVVGVNYAPQHSGDSGLYAYVPATLQLNEQWDVNANLGWDYVQHNGANAATWGLGTEYHATKEFSWVGEVFGRDREEPGIQLGPRLTVANMQFDLVYGHNVFNDDEQLVTAGLTFNW